MRQDLASCIVFPDVSEGFLGILPEPPEHSLPVGFLLFMSVLWHTRYCLGRVGFVAVCSIVVYIRVLQGTVPQPIRFSVASHTADRPSLFCLGGRLSRRGWALSASHILPGTFATWIACPTRPASYLVLRRGSLLYGTDSLAVLQAVIFLVLGVCCAHHWNSWADPIRREAIPLAKAVRQTHS